MYVLNIDKLNYILNIKKKFRILIYLLYLDF